MESETLINPETLIVVSILAILLAAVVLIAAVVARRHAKRDAEVLRRSANGLIYPVPGRKR